MKPNRDVVEKPDGDILDVTGIDGVEEREEVETEGG